MQAAFLWYFKIFLCCKPLFQLHFCGSVKRHLLSNVTQWLKILKKVSFSNSLNFSSLSQNELFWRVEFEYNETFLGWFSNTVCWLFKLSRHSQISAQLPKNLSQCFYISTIYGQIFLFLPCNAALWCVFLGLQSDNGPNPPNNIQIAVAKQNM